MRRAALLGLALLCACRDAPPVPTEPLSAVVDGCVAWSPSGDCEHTPGTTLRIWHPGAPSGAVEVDGEAVKAEAVEVDTGFRLTVEVPERGRALAVTSGTRRFDLPLSPVATSTPTDPGRRRVKARFQTGRGLLRAGRLEAGYAAVVAAAEEAKKIGDDHVARDAMLLAVFQDAVVRGDLVTAERLVSSAPRPRPEDGRGRLLLRYHEGVVASRVLDARGALAALAEAERWARRLGSPILDGAVQERARVLIDLGAGRKAAQVLDRLLAERGQQMAPCVNAALSTTAGWARITARPRFQERVARARFEAALATFQAACPRAPDANNVRVNLALLARQTDPAASRAWLARVSGPEQPEARMWRHALEAGLDRAEGRWPQARRAYARLAAEAEEQSHEALRWQAELGLGLVDRAQGRLAGAIRHFESAETILLQQTALVPVNQGRQFLLEERAESSRRLVEAHLSAGRRRAAWESARRARRRSVRALAVRDALEALPEARRSGFTERLSNYRNAKRALEGAQLKAWQVPAGQRARFEAGLEARRVEVERALDAAIAYLGQSAGGASLPVPSGNETWLMPFSLAPGGGVVFAATAKRIEVVSHTGRVEQSHWQAALRRVGRRSGQVVLLADPREASALERLEGVPMVLYGLDLGSGETTTASAALVIFDPRGDLADARAEGREVADALRASRPVRTLGPGQATPDRVRAELEQVGLLHFAGHGKYAGDEGWQSQLLLSDGAFDLGDLATLPAPPRWAVLSGCETARTRAGRSSAGLGLAQALLAAGTELAVATRVPVPSRDARVFSRALYDALGRDEDLVRAFGAARAHLDAAGIDATPFVLLSR